MIYKKTLLIIFILLLTMPVIERYFKFFEFEPLDGAFTNTQKKEFKISDFLNNSYQTVLEQNITDSIGFKVPFVRLYNQIGYSVFNDAKNAGCVVGKEGYLFLYSYIDGYRGTNYKDETEIFEKAKKIKAIQKYLTDNNKTFFIVLAPGKASYYPEYLPEFAFKQKKNLNELYSELFNKNNINYINLQTYFNELKDTVQIPLYPKNGVHWSSYGMALSMDTIMKTIEDYRDIKLPEFKISYPIEFSDSIQKPDYDVELNMNLFFDIDKAPMPYPKYKYSSDSLSSKPKVLMISDSYYWQPYAQNIPHNVFSWGGFWFYFKTLYPEVEGIARKTEDVNLYEEIEKQDVVILMASEATLHMFPFGFAKQFEKDILLSDISSLTEYYITQIKSDIKWYNDIKVKANDNNISVEEQLQLDAVFMAKEELGKRDQKSKLIESKINEIKRNNDWYNDIKEKAEKNNITVEEQLRIDAEWVIENVP